jgi:hypothetical protein
VHLHANPTMSTIPFAECCTSVEHVLKDRFGIGVITRDIPDPLTGDLDGLEIHVDYAATSELRLFLLAHLFGHTVQWNVDPKTFELGRQYKPPVREALFPAILAYEQEAACYGLSLLHEAGVMTVDKWFSKYSACDQAYLLDFYRTGEKHDFQSFWRETVDLLVPKPIPCFTPTRRTFRMDGIVI